MGRITDRRRVTRVVLDGSRPGGERPDTLVVEDPLEVRVEGRPLSVTMRTPGDDFDLVAGFLVGEGVARRAEDLRAMTHCADDVVEVSLAPGVAPPDLSLERHVYTSSSCGVCGTASIEAVRRSSSYDVTTDPVTVDAGVLAVLPERLRAEQRVFARTGGLHAAGLFTAAGAMVCVREDVGRHNAVDKVVGWALREGRLPLRGHVLQVSGRASFELVQKAWLAGVPVLAAVSAPSTLAVDLAAEAGMTLVGFSRGRSFNVYAGAERVSGPSR